LGLVAILGEHSSLPPISMPAGGLKIRCEGGEFAVGCDWALQKFHAGKQDSPTKVLCISAMDMSGHPPHHTMFQPLLKRSEWLLCERVMNTSTGISPAYTDKSSAHIPRADRRCVQHHRGSSGFLAMRQSRIYAFEFFSNMTKTCAYHKTWTGDHCFHVPLPTPFT